jgi:hypothetical protein
LLGRGRVWAPCGPRPRPRRTGLGSAIDAGSRARIGECGRDGQGGRKRGALPSPPPLTSALLLPPRHHSLAAFRCACAALDECAGHSQTPRQGRGAAIGIGVGAKEARRRVLLAVSAGECGKGNIASPLSLFLGGASLARARLSQCWRADRPHRAGSGLWPTPIGGASARPQSREPRDLSPAGEGKEREGRRRGEAAESLSLGVVLLMRCVRCYCESVLE